MSVGSDEGITLCLNCGWEREGPVDLAEHFVDGRCPQRIVLEMARQRPARRRLGPRLIRGGFEVREVLDA